MSLPDTRSENSAQAGLASRQDAPEIARRIQRRLTLVVPKIRARIFSARETLRRLRGGRHVIDFFHQVDDAYSQLAIEAIRPLLDRYDVVFRFHLVSQTDRLHASEPYMLADYARRDCAWVAPYYGLDFPKDAEPPSDDTVRKVQSLLASLTDDPLFLTVAAEAGRALWTADDAGLARLVERVPSASTSEVTAALESGNALRKKRRHYSGAMFWYAGEWYWGVDRLHHLERRLIEYGASRIDHGASQPSEEPPRFARPPIDAGTIRNSGRLSLQIFPSLRSPYTSIIFDRSLEMAAVLDIPVSVRPVMPMVMRGVPAPVAKGLYIMLDTLREAQHLGVPFGDMYDPIGRPVERGFSLWPFARDHGRGAEFISSFLRAAFIEGRETGSDEGIRRVVEEAGLDWTDAQKSLDTQYWRPELEANRQDMYNELGLWGVPSYRLQGPEGEPDLCVWGQDRLWLIAAEIKRRLTMIQSTEA